MQYSTATPIKQRSTIVNAPATFVRDGRENHAANRPNTTSAPTAACCAIQKVRKVFSHGALVREWSYQETIQQRPSQSVLVALEHAANSHLRSKASQDVTCNGPRSRRAEAAAVMPKT